MCVCVENKKAVHPKPMNHWWATDECISFEIEDFFFQKKREEKTRRIQGKNVETHRIQMAASHCMNVNVPKKKVLNETT